MGLVAVRREMVVYSYPRREIIWRGWWVGVLGRMGCSVGRSSESRRSDNEAELSQGYSCEGFIETHTGSAIEHPEPEIEKR
jgi:hypothetical protein